jgi:hypothetical protein
MRPAPFHATVFGIAEFLAAAPIAFTRAAPVTAADAGWSGWGCDGLGVGEGRDADQRKRQQNGFHGDHSFKTTTRTARSGVDLDDACPNLNQAPDQGDAAAWAG